MGSDGDVLGDPEDALAERLTRLVIDSELEDPAIMRAVHTRDPPQVTTGRGLRGGRGHGSHSAVLTLSCALQQPGGLNSSIWDSSAVLRRIRGPLLAQVGDPKSLCGRWVGWAVPGIAAAPGARWGPSQLSPSVTWKAGMAGFC